MQIDPKQLQRMMKQMGIDTEELDAKRVIIEQEDKKIILNEPKVIKIIARGEVSFQITSEEIKEEEMIPEEDIKLVAEQANVDKETARKALEDANGDVAEAIMKLKK
ncbi:MAG: nascent polypeptide-associated complex protein [Candidatus Micrarchaeota archaeon]|nr:nascent polypeptide-associated complex protein [Candidatus Micrarchaeota archaeon]